VCGVEMRRALGAAAGAVAMTTERVLHVLCLCQKGLNGLSGCKVVSQLENMSSSPSVLCMKLYLPITAF
jgi:hypothetical protein